MAKVVAFGEILIDFAQKSAKDGYPLLQAQPGGAPANFLAAVKKYGHDAYMMGKVGNDTFGHLLINTLNTAGISTENVIADDNYFTTLAFVTLDESGDRSFSFARKPGADTQFREDEINIALIESADVFHFGTLSLTDDKSANTTKACIRKARESGSVISCDPNLRLVLWDSAKRARDAMKWAVSQADIVKISDEEVEFMFECDEKAGADILINEYGVKLVYITLGPKGCYYACGDIRGYAMCPDGIKAIDTTGAGDIFGGSAMAQFLDINKSIDELKQEDLDRICTFACRRASLSTLKNGGIMSVPEKSEVI